MLRQALVHLLEVLKDGDGMEKFKGKVGVLQHT